jgi:hypothetical protein
VNIRTGCLGEWEVEQAKTGRRGVGWGKEDDAKSEGLRGGT